MSSLRRSRVSPFALLGLLGLAGCGAGSSGAPPAPAPPAEMARPDGLLTDAQLRTSLDANAARTGDDAVLWFAQNAKTIRSLTAGESFADLAFLDAPLAGKRLVMLGESSHGAEEFSQAKVRLIKYLHQNLGYSVLAFESGLFDCERGQTLIERRSAGAALDACLFGVWHTQTVRELFDYIRASQDSANPLRITGFDVQASGNRFAERAGHTAALVAKAAPDYAADVRALEDDYRQRIDAARAATRGSDASVMNLRSALARWAGDYAALADYLLANIEVIVADGEFTRREVRVAAQYARTSVYFAEQVSQQFAFESGGRARDLGMAENFIALAEQIFPDDKIIGWAHNAHIRHRGSGFLPNGNMGTWVHDRWSAELYTVGFYMYRGQHAFNDRSVQDVNPPQNFSLEAIFHSRRLAYLFLDLAGAPSDQPGGRWINATTPTWAWGRFATPLRLAEEYDGLVLIDRVTVPAYLN